MKSHRRGLTPIAITVLLSAALCASAQASPLLSGYGGPGQGSQAILGSALVNGPPRGGGGSRGGGGGSQSAPAATSSPAPPAASSPSAAALVARGGGAGRAASAGSRVLRARARSGSRGAFARTQGGVRAASAPRGASALPSGAYPVSERGAPASSGAIGLSASDLLEGLLVLCALGLAVVAMRRLGGRPTRGVGPDEQLGAGN